MVDVSRIRIEVVQAWPRRHCAMALDLPHGTTVAEAVAASGLETAGISGYAVHGRRVEPGASLRDGDRLELLRPLLLDPKDARRRRASAGS
jgi:uncharacterized protein